VLRFKMKKINLIIPVLLSFISLVFAHTGNDAVDHSFKLADGIIGILIIFIIGIIGIYLIKKRRKN